MATERDDDVDRTGVGDAPDRPGSAVPASGAADGAATDAVGDAGDTGDADGAAAVAAARPDGGSGTAEDADPDVKIVRDDDGGTADDDAVADDDADGAAADDEADAEVGAAADDTGRDPATVAFWEDADVDPVEVALPRGVGLTLRHYRRTKDEDEDVVEEAAFLVSDGKLHLFRSAEGLVAFVRSDAEHDLTDVDDWAEIAAGVEPGLVVPDDEDRYELDLVVENLRGGRDVWERDLLVGAGEVARDVAFACGLNDVLAALAPGTPLDTLDEAMRDGGFFAKRKLRRIGPDQAALAWRTVIGKISVAVEWHD